MSYFGPATKLFFLQVMWWNCSGDWIYIFFASRHSSKHVSCSHTHTITTKREFYLALISSDLPSLLLREISLLFSKLFSLVLGSLIVMHMFDYMDSRHRDHSSQSSRVLLIEVWLYNFFPFKSLLYFSLFTSRDMSCNECRFWGFVC